MPGPWSPIHLAVTAHGVVAVAWLTTPTTFERSLGHPPARVGRRGDATTPDGPWRAAHGAGVGRARAASWPARRAGASSRSTCATGPTGIGASSPTVREIPLGATASYGEIARRIGRPGAARAVGGAVGRNPITPAHPVPSGHRRRRHARRLRRRWLGRSRGARSPSSAICSCAKASRSVRRRG